MSGHSVHTSSTRKARPSQGGTIFTRLIKIDVAARTRRRSAPEPASAHDHRPPRVKCVRPHKKGKASVATGELPGITTKRSLRGVRAVGSALISSSSTTKDLTVGEIRNTLEKLPHSATNSVAGCSQEGPLRRQRSRRRRRELLSAAPKPSRRMQDDGDAWSAERSVGRAVRDAITGLARAASAQCDARKLLSSPHAANQMII